MRPENKCPTCGLEIASDSIDGQCLKCLGRLGFFSELDDPNHGGTLRLDDYELLEEVARGGMGVVYRARQISLNRVVAVKVLLHGLFSSPEFVRRFRNEAEAAATLRHPNIVTVHEVGEFNGHHFLSMEFVDGRNLADVVREQPLPARRAAGYVKSIAEAVHHAHLRGVLHRDLKPSNVLLDPLDQPRITDFGLAKILDRDMEITATGEVLGSPGHMAPEQAAGKFAQCTVRSDVYSLGSILYQLICGRPPFQGGTVAELLAQVQISEPIPPRRLNPGVPEDLQSICLKCLQKESSRRYASAQELALDLGRFLDQKPVMARPVSSVGRAWLWCRRRPLLSSVSAGFVMALVFGMAGIVWEWRQAERHAQGELKQRHIAEQDAAETRLNLYASDVNVAWQALEDGDYGLARRRLEALRPKPGETDLRGFEWRYLLNLCHGDQLATLAGHRGTVNCVAFSPDGTRIATGSHDGTVRIWNEEKQESVATLNVSSAAVWSVAFTPDGQCLMTGSGGQVGFWSTGSGQLRTHFPGTLAALSKTGTFLATAESSPFFWEPAGAVKLWNWSTGQLLRSYERPGRALALSADGGLLAIAGASSNITVWDTVAGNQVRECPSAGPVWSLSFSPDGRELLAADWSSDVSVWKVDDNSPARPLSGHLLHVWSAVFSGDGAAIATTSGDQTVRLWDAATLRPKAVLRGHSSEVWCAAFSPDGKVLATGGKDHNVMLWSTAARPQIELPHDMDFRPIISPDGKRLVTMDHESESSMLWNAEDGLLLARHVATGKQVIGFSRDGTHLLTFDTDNVRLQFWLPQGATPEKQVLLEGLKPTEPASSFYGLSPEQGCLFEIDAAGLIRIWNTDTGGLLRTIQGPLPPIRNAVLSAGGKKMAVCTERENVARLYDCATGKELQLAGHSDFVSGLAFSLDGAMIATGSMDGTIRLWNTATGETIASLPGHMQEATDVAFSPDGRTLASLGRNESLKLWHVPTLRELISERDPHAGQWLEFFPDGRKLAVERGPYNLRFLSAPSE